MIACTIRVAYQGEPGAFSEDAIDAFFAGRDTAWLPQREFIDVRRVVLSGDAEYGVLPVENSIHGPVTPAHEVLSAGGLSVVGELTCPIRLCLLAAPGVRPEQLRRVLSHPVALSQCRQFLGRMPLVAAVPFHDTAGAAKEVAAQGDSVTGAVSSLAAAEHYGLDIIARNIEDAADNRTRFVIVTRAARAASAGT